MEALCGATLTNTSSNQDYSDYVGTFDFTTPPLKSPLWPLITSVLFLVASVAIIAVERSSQGSTLLAVALLGYILTPLGTAAMLILAMRSHKNLSSKPGYNDSTGKAQIKYCSLIAWAGFIAAIPHVWFIADYFSLMFAPGVGS